MTLSKQYRDNMDGGPVSTKEIKQVAELLGMSDEGVRIYARRGFVHPDVREGSRVRSFDMMDFTMLLYSRVYRKSDFSLKETERIVEAGDVETIQRMYGVKICELEEELVQKRIVLECLRDASKAMESIPLLSNRCEIAPFPGLYRIEFMFSPSVWCDDPEQRELISTWAGYAPCTMISTRYSIRDLLDGRQPTTALAGMGMYAKHASHFSVQAGGQVSFVPPCDRAVHTVFSADNKQLIPDMGPVITYLAENSLEPASDAITLGIVNTGFGTTFTRYFHLWIPLV